jgi:hypothetical protein
MYVPHVELYSPVQPAVGSYDNKSLSAQITSAIYVDSRNTFVMWPFNGYRLLVKFASDGAQNTGPR